MKLRPSLVSLTLSLPLLAQHHTTPSWLKEMRNQSQIYNSLTTNENLSHDWSEDGKILNYDLEISPGTRSKKSLNLETGEVIDTAAPHPKNSIPADRLLPPIRFAQHHGKTSPNQKFLIERSPRSITLNENSQKTTLEFALPDGSEWADRPIWHADSSCFAMLHRTDHPTREVHLIRSSPKDSPHPEHIIHPYQKPGDPLNVPIPVIFFTDGREPLPIDPSLIPDPFQISNLQWHPTAPLLTLTYIERGFGKYRLLEINTQSRSQRILAAEESDRFVYVYGNCYYQILPDTNEILWLSERSGYNHLYLIDQKTAEVIRPLTHGNWVVRQILGVDPENRRAFIAFSGYDPDQDPYYLHFGFVDLDTAKLTRLTEANGTHELLFSPNHQFYLAKWSRIDHPKTYEVRRSSDAKLIATLNQPDLTPLLESGWQLPQRFVTKDRNGKHDIHGGIWRPSTFKKGEDKKYPVIENIYAGPHGSFVPKTWRPWSGHISEIAESGFIVVQIDGLGTNHRGRDFHQIAYQNLKDSGFPDRIKWLREAAAQFPELDLSRVGIYGGSAGGQSALAALLHHGDFYHAAAADCGCHDNRVDKIWWNEQWLDWPVNESYIENSNRTHIKNLAGTLFLTVGELDRNVDPSSTFQIVNDLIQADKDFEFYLIPNADHGAGEAPYFRKKRIDFFKKHLQ